MLHVNVDRYHTTNRTATTNGPISLAGAADLGKYGYGNGFTVMERISGTVLWSLVKFDKMWENGTSLLSKTMVCYNIDGKMGKSRKLTKPPPNPTPIYPSPELYVSKVLKLLLFRWIVFTRAPLANVLGVLYKTPSLEPMGPTIGVLISQWFIIKSF